MLEYNLSAGILPLRKSFSKSNGSIITIDTPYNHSNFIKTYTGYRTKSVAILVPKICK